jgi:hypothetical protein
MRWPRVREVVLFGHAWRLSRVAQRVGRVPLPVVAGEMGAAALLPRGSAPDEAWRAAVRAGTRVARRGLRIDTCLTRSLVVGALLSDRDDVVLHVGFRPGAVGEGGEASAVHDGHAWVTVAGREVTPAEAAPGHAGPFTEILRIPMRRPGGKR